MAVEPSPGTAAPKAPDTRLVTTPGFTLNVEWVAWAAVLVVGGLLRFPGLGAQPPATVEAIPARVAWEFARGSTPSGWGGDLQTALAALLIRLGGDSLFWVRLGPAVLGLGAVAALAFFRPYAGRAAPWLAALLLSISPLAVASSRALSPDPAALLLGLGLLWCVLRVSVDGDRRALPVLGLVTGLSLAAGSVALALALVAGVWLAIEIVWLRRTEVAERWQNLAERRRDLFVALACAVPGVALGLVRFGAGPEGLRLPALADWSGPLPDTAPVLPWHAPLAWLPAYEILPLALGTVGLLLLVRRWRRSGGGALSPFERLAVVWALAALMLVPAALHDRPGQGLVLALPLLLLTAHATLDRAPGMAAVRWKFTGPLLLPVVFILVFALVRFLSWADSGAIPRNEGGGLIVLAIMAVALTVFALYQSPPPAWSALPVVLAWPVLGLAALHGASAVAFGSGLELVRGQQAMAQRETIVRGIETALGEGRTVAVDRSLAAALAWELRGRDVSLFIGMPPPADSVVRVARPEVMDGYAAVGAVVNVEQRWYPAGWNVTALLRWWFFRGPREVDTTLNAELLHRVDPAR